MNAFHRHLRQAYLRDEIKSAAQTLRRIRPAYRQMHSVSSRVGPCKDLFVALLRAHVHLQACSLQRETARLRKRVRHLHLALGLLRGRTFRQLEPAPRTRPDMALVRSMAGMMPRASTRGALSLWFKEGGLSWREARAKWRIENEHGRLQQTRSRPSGRGPQAA